MIFPTLLFFAASLDTPALQRDFDQLAKGFKGRVGVCVSAEGKFVCLNPDQKFSIQSVVKMMVGMTVLDAVDSKGWSLETKLRIYKKDLSVSRQPLADLVGPDGFETTIGDLVRRANVDSDSAACDILIDRLGGVAVLQDFINRKGIRGMRIDRDERFLQSNTAGLTWHPEYVAPKIFDAARAAIPEAKRSEAWLSYKNDPRDTSTPTAMLDLLDKLVRGKLLSPKSTAFLMSVMEQCTTAEDRLTASLNPGWRLGHRSGTSGTWKGLSIATNDVGFLRAPDGSIILIAVFVADSTESNDRNAAMIANLARASIRRTRLNPSK